MSEENKVNLITEDNSANLIFDLINKSEQFGNIKIDIIICNENPWFKGKDVATILGYKRSNDAINDHVKIKNKSTLSELYDKIGHGEMPYLTYNQKNTIYINEAGLYAINSASGRPKSHK